MTLEVQDTPIGSPPDIDVEQAAARQPPTIAPDLASAFVANGLAQEKLAQLLNGQAWCVTSGQQPGLLTGPLFTVYKALTAIGFARAVERRLGRPVVPVFWVAGDDHDLAEANHVHVLTPANELERIELRHRQPDAPLIPLYRETLGRNIETVLSQLAGSTPDTEFKESTFEWLARHYHEDTDVASAFAGALAELLGPFGLVVFRPTEPAAKRLMAPVLLRALERGNELDSMLADTAARLQRSGRAAPIAVGEGASTVFIESTLGRDRLVLDGAAYRERRSGREWTFAQLKQVAQQEPQLLSPNVLLRPVVEAALLPTLAYVAGPGELAYLPQADPLYQELGVVPQAVVSRWAGRVVETRVAKVLEKYAIAPEDLDAPEGQIEARLVREEMPQGAAQAIQHLRRTLTAEYERLSGAVNELDSTLTKPVQSQAHNALRAVNEIEKRIISHLKKRNDIVVQQIAKARLSLYPLGTPQERVLNVVPFLIRYGSSFLDLVHERCTQWTSRALESQLGGA